MAMNIFVLHEDPEIAARLMYDEHVRSKMIVESAQMLATCFDLAVLAEEAPLTQQGAPRKHAYVNHPCAKWVRESTMNMKWLCVHAEAMEIERFHRFKCNSHSTMEFIRWVDDNIHLSTTPDSDNLTPFAVAINAGCKCVDHPGYMVGDVPTKYRLYYDIDKFYMHRTNPSVDPGMYMY